MSGHANRGNASGNEDNQSKRGKGFFKSIFGKSSKPFTKPIEDLMAARFSTSGGPSASNNPSSPERPSTSGRHSLSTPPSSSRKIKEERLLSGRYKVPPPELDTTGMNIPDVGPLRDLLYHPSVYARAGAFPSRRNSTYRGAWTSAHELVRSAHPYRHIFTNTGFDNFLAIEPMAVDHRYLQVLVEKWFSCTNTIHLTMGEIGPTPLAWSMITGLIFTDIPVPLSQTPISRDAAYALLGLGNEAFRRDRNKIRIEALKGNIDWTVDPPEEERTWRERRIFLYFLCSCFFNNQASTVHPNLVYALSDWDAIGSYDWCGLAFGEFLAGMRRCTAKPYGGLTGFWQFLLFWSFEHFPIFRPPVGERDIIPRAAAWRTVYHADPSNLPDVILARAHLEALEIPDVEWNPYRDSIYSSTTMRNAAVLSLHRLTFPALDGWEYYLGERHWRTFYGQAAIPAPPPFPSFGLPRTPQPLEIIPITELADSSVNEMGYLTWFIQNSIGPLTSLEQLVREYCFGQRVCDLWMIRSRTDLVPRERFNQLLQAYENSQREIAELTETLSRAQTRRCGLDQD